MITYGRLNIPSNNSANDSIDFDDFIQFLIKQGYNKDDIIELLKDEKVKMRLVLFYRLSNNSKLNTR